MVTNSKPTRRDELARALDAAFSGCETWTVVENKRRETTLPADNPIAVAQAENASSATIRRKSPSY